MQVFNHRNLSNVVLVQASLNDDVIKAMEWFCKDTPLAQSLPHYLQKSALVIKITPSRYKKGFKEVHSNIAITPPRLKVMESCINFQKSKINNMFRHKKDIAYVIISICVMMCVFLG